MENQLPWNIIVAALLSLVGGLIIFYLRSIKQCLTTLGQRIDRSETDIKQITRQIADCKVDCQRTTVSKEDWVRGEAVSRGELKNITTCLNRMEGKLTVVERLPDICGQIAGQIAAKFQGVKPNG